MAAYVDPASWYWRDQYWCHLIADSLAELHDFAALVGKPRLAFQDKRLPHYDLTARQRAIALDFGALAVSSRDIVVVSRRLREEAAALRARRTDAAGRRGAQCPVLTGFQPG